jgi:predicted nucleic acid-binding protein
MLLVDNSAWARLNSRKLDSARRQQIAELLESGQALVCLPFLLEAGYSARSAADHAAMMARLVALPMVHVTRQIQEAALRAQRELAQVGHHRVAPNDLVIAACATAVDAGVLHYDRDFDLIAQRTSLRLRSEWLAAAGTI